ncbi:hypothetical protein MM239_10140 [Belliella sp. DSM 111904]|uniref:TonB protein C-terminal n=1 Tax=Belliella filtrata TaxID=2923435 RepID=A0ABS9V023_9BACT|nr:hypothetical protein [Belliella filtrata]MCH7409754.1 hypothetical protein [Belliella filtrata]
MDNQELILTSNDFYPSINKEKISIPQLIKETMNIYMPKGQSTNHILKLGFLINEHGEVEDFQLLNDRKNTYSIKKNALSVLQEKDIEFKPALDLDGKPTTRWLYFTINQTFKSESKFTYLFGKKIHNGVYVKACSLKKV